MKYPCITRNDNEIEMILFNEGTAIILNGIHKGKLHDVYQRFRSRYTNITSEYLSNTWGVVESKEHAEFIVELCKVNDIEVFNGFDIGITNFAIVKNEVIFTYGKPQVSEHDKQITIPLPPKADINEAGHNLVFAASECKEWPCVNDRVTWGNKVCSGIIKAIDGNLAWIKNEHGNYVTEYIDKLQKPKTLEEALRDDIIELTLSHMENKSHPIEANAYYLFSELLTKYNITPKD